MISMKLLPKLCSGTSHTTNKENNSQKRCNVKPVIFMSLGKTGFDPIFALPATGNITKTKQMDTSKHAKGYPKAITHFGYQLLQRTN